MKYWLLICCVLSASLSAETTVIEEYDFYKVSPANVNALLTSLNKRSPITQDGAVFHANTQYHLHTKFGWKKSGKLCRLTQVKTTLKLQYTMPKLASSKKSVKAIWSKWYPQLTLHERGHGLLAKKIALATDRKILALKNKQDCRQLQKRAYTIANKAKLQLKESFQDYDKRTNHGETQGAWIYAYL